MLFSITKMAEGIDLMIQRCQNESSACGTDMDNTADLYVFKLSILSESTLRGDKSADGILSKTMDSKEMVLVLARDSAELTAAMSCLPISERTR